MEYNPSSKQPRPGRRPSSGQYNALVVRVLDDPTDLFRPGAEFPAVQVFGNCRPGHEKMPAPDEWPLGMLLRYNGMVYRTTPRGWEKVLEE